MLVLTRHRDERIVLTLPSGPDLMALAGARVTICVVTLTEDKARLGFEAADSIEIDRYEVRRIKDAEIRRRAEGGAA